MDVENVIIISSSNVWENGNPTYYDIKGLLRDLRAPPGLTGILHLDQIVKKFGCNIDQQAVDDILSGLVWAMKHCWSNTPIMYEPTSSIWFLRGALVLKHHGFHYTVYAKGNGDNNYLIAHLARPESPALEVAAGDSSDPVAETTLPTDIIGEINKWLTPRSYFSLASTSRNTRDMTKKEGEYRRYLKYAPNLTLVRALEAGDILYAGHALDNGGSLEQMRRKLAKLYSRDRLSPDAMKFIMNNSMFTSLYIGFANLDVAIIKNVSEFSHRDHYSFIEDVKIVCSTDKFNIDDLNYFRNFNSDKAYSRRKVLGIELDVRILGFSKELARHILANYDTHPLISSFKEEIIVVYFEQLSSRSHCIDSILYSFLRAVPSPGDPLIDTVLRLYPNIPLYQYYQSIQEEGMIDVEYKYKSTFLVAMYRQGRYEDMIKLMGFQQRQAPVKRLAAAILVYSLYKTMFIKGDHLCQLQEKGDVDIELDYDVMLLALKRLLSWSDLMEIWGWSHHVSTDPTSIRDYQMDIWVDEADYPIYLKFLAFIKTEPSIAAKSLKGVGFYWNTFTAHIS